MERFQDMDGTGPDIYQERGFEDRKAYLESLADDNGVTIETVTMLADLLGPNEDFDGLVTSVQDAAS